MRSDDVRMDGLLEHVQAVFEIDLPEWLAEFGERVAAPHVIDQNVESLVAAFDSGDELFHIGWFRVIHAYRNAAPACCGDEFGGFFDGFRAPGSGAACAGTAPGAVNGGTGFAKRDGNPASGAARGSGNQRDAAAQIWWAIRATGFHEAGCSD